ncbi:MAG: hypothetical protein ACREHG_08995 [Candidatus Saccharimonadales bacterium]
MFIVSFLRWWYGTGWANVLSGLRTHAEGVLDAFSMPQLSRTMFAPWRRIISYPGAGLDARIKAWADNLFSRTIGFVVRLLVLLTACLTLSLVILVSLLEFVLWPLLPPAAIGCLIAGVLI